MSYGPCKDGIDNDRYNIFFHGSCMYVELKVHTTIALTNGNEAIHEDDNELYQ